MIRSGTEQPKRSTATLRARLQLVPPPVQVADTEDPAVRTSDSHGVTVAEAGSVQKLRQEIRRLRNSITSAQSALADALLEAERAWHMARHDGLTALPNHEYFRQCVTHALARRREPTGVAVLFIDLDGFKQLNDRHGHRTGDALLKIVARRLAHVVRDEDMVSRLGGDEFGCLLQSMPDRRRIEDVAVKIFDSVSGPLDVGGLTLQINPSIGIAMTPVDGMDTDTLLHRADLAMYRAKLKHTRHAFFTERT